MVKHIQKGKAPMRPLLPYSLAAAIMLVAAVAPWAKGAETSTEDDVTRVAAQIDRLIEARWQQAGATPFRAGRRCHLPPPRLACTLAAAFRRSR